MTRTNFKTTEKPEDGRQAALKIGELSKLSGIGIEALRFYEKSGLLDRPSRTVSGYRLYDEKALDRLAFIKRAQMLGFSLDEIRQIIAESEAGQSPCAGVREVVRKRLQELDERMAQMRRYRRELALALEQWDRAGEVRGHICGLIENTSLEQTPPASRKLAGRRNRSKEDGHGK
ncbi:MAG TPA: heavy metal-responsive transcriptional regulator [Pyrinomonadaceae bacterium]|jgi:DNA-binding transcriptional MerR regulator